MEFPLQNEVHYKEEIARAGQPLIRLYNPTYIGKNLFGKPYSDSMMQGLNENDFYSGQWQTCDSNSVKTMSAIGYYFGKRIVASEAIPVGLIHLAIGGCPLETFISRQTLAASKQFASKVSGNWLQNDALPVWVKQRGAENISKQKIIYADDTGPAHAYKPGFAYAAGIEPVLGTAIKGVLWYQGESNSQESERVNEYGNLLKLMINDYRIKWKQPGMPFYWVQLSSIDTTGYKSQLWPVFRDEQRKLINEISFGGMAVCSDIGFRNNVHPTNKKEVAERLAHWALNRTYHKKNIPSEPLPVSAIYKQGNIVVSFQYADGLQTADGKLLRGFSAGDTTDLQAFIKGNKVMIPRKDKPAYVYYGWKPFTDANLVNKEKLPVSTFKIKTQ
ncbi:MAG: sialate O-acetylesterase, partial [Bacteroidota bacterium]